MTVLHSEPLTAIHNHPCTITVTHTPHACPAMSFCLQVAAEAGGAHTAAATVVGAVPVVGAAS